MANKKSSNTIRIWGVTLPSPEFRFKPCGFGFKSTNAGYIAYTDIYIGDLVTYIKAQGLSNQIIKKLK